MINDVKSFSFFAYVITQTQGEIGSVTGLLMKKIMKERRKI